MAMMYAYLVMMIGIEMLLAFAGVDTGMGLLLGTFNVIDSPQSITSSTIYVVIASIFVSAGIVSIIAGFFSNNNRESFLLGGVAAFLLAFVADLASIIVYMKGLYPTSPVTYIITFIFGVLIVGYLITIIDWWRNGA